MSRIGFNLEFDEWGTPHREPDTTGMIYPMKCTRCTHVHDAGKVTVLQRYTDCSVWRCPNCKQLIDDRPQAWGGSAVRVRRRP